MNQHLRFFALSLLLATPATAQSTIDVQSINLSFVPADITINVGDTVRWTFVSGGSHTVTEGLGPFPDGSEAFGSFLEVSVPVFELTFDEAFLQANPRPGDVYDYYCIPHIFAGMIGTITVLGNNAEGPGTSSCNGDGGDQMGCTDCPCNNNAAQGTVGGCLNSAGTSTQLIASGSASVASADLRIEASGAPPFNSCQLTSGNAIAPANSSNPCFGLDSGITSFALDGLRCAVQGVLRHGVRPSDANGEVGVTTNGWGTPNGFFNFGAFTAGQTKHFQIIHRDDVSTVCMTGQNTSQAVSVTFGS